VEEHLRRRAPWGAEVKVMPCREGEPHTIDVSGQAFQAFRRACADTWGRVPFEFGSGGCSRWWPRWPRRIPGTAMLLTGVEDLESNAHSENESVHLGELRNCCINEAMLPGHLASRA
jgi:acetylornithine deacetylase/succinyl-diaminopimelate desuccinylase-like protein